MLSLFQSLNNVHIKIKLHLSWFVVRFLFRAGVWLVCRKRRRHVSYVICLSSQEESSGRGTDWSTSGTLGWAWEFHSEDSEIRKRQGWGLMHGWAFAQQGQVLMGREMRMECVF